MLRQIGSGIGVAGKRVGETGTVVDVGGSVGAPGQRHIGADVERVALVVIERTPGEIGKIRQATVNESSGARYLVGVSEVELGAVFDAGGAQGEFPAANEGPLNR